MRPAARAPLIRRFLAIAASIALAVAFVSLTPRTSVAINTCLTGYYCGTLELTPTELANGSGTVTTADGLIDCTVTNGHDFAGTCKTDYAWKTISGTTYPAEVTLSPTSFSYACAPGGGCGPVGQAIVFGVNVVNTGITLGAINLELTRYTLDIIQAGGDHGSVSIDGVGCTASECTVSELYGTGHTLVVDPDSGWIFSGWSGGCSSFGINPTCTLTMTGNFVTTYTLAPAPTPTPSPSVRPTAAPSPSAGASHAPTPRPSGTPASTVSVVPGVSRPPGGSSPSGGPTPSTGSSGSPAGSQGPTAGPPTSGTALSTMPDSTDSPLPGPPGSGPGTSPVGSGSDTVPWLPIIVIIVLVIGGLNLAIFQMRRGRPR